MANLYELTGYAERLNAALAGELTDAEWVELRQEFDSAVTAIVDKLDAYARVIRNLQSESDAYRAEEARLAALRGKVDKSIDRMNAAVYEAVRACDKQKVKTSIGTWAIQKNSPAVEVTDRDAIPMAYKVVQPMKIDVAAILDALKAGETVEGAKLTQGDSLRFR